ncbi:DUF1565 domain-containing protein [Pleurocapsa sp. PCC 7319]|uniref:DUF1565 domain-containing protein n=1 Tax=Pleurocapsa sp. PCC 7319 TaxID=118161 RepID=UPI00034AB76B|nr:DUF1565 domain-containing protein [Pleurocapsa sp. PCC 7319]
MESSNYQIANRHRFCSIKLSTADKYIRLLLVALTVALPSKIALQAQPTLAQETIAQSLSLDKNTIYVNPKTGDDSQSGKNLSPLKTITQALKIAPSGSTIKLSSGTYSEETGETFPLIINKDITLRGNAKSQGHQIIIKGNGYFISPTGAGQNVAIAALKDAGGITGVTVTNDHSRGHGLWIESSSPEVIGNTFTRNGNTGVSVNGNSSPHIENNYFYNNSGNGLLVYGTSQPEVINNSFERTGFGVSIVQDSAPTLTGNYFNSNRIGIILEGNSQGILRNNEIINSGEYGLTAIAQSKVDLGTSAEPGNNIFRSNQKLDIQNATNNQIVAVGTKVSGQTEGDVNFSNGEFIAINQTNNNEDLPPLPSSRLAPRDRPLEPLDLPKPAATPVRSSATTASLPSPPPLPRDNTKNKELIFTSAPDPEVTSNSYSSSPAPEPVPFLPEISNPALSSKSSQITSLSDVLGSSGASQVKYKVLVEALGKDAEADVRSLYPQAFSTVYQGKSVLQVGAFNNWDKAKQAMRSLENLGLNTHILE